MWRLENQVYWGLRVKDKNEQICLPLPFLFYSDPHRLDDALLHGWGQIFARSMLILPKNTLPDTPRNTLFLGLPLVQSRWCIKLTKRHICLLVFLSVYSWNNISPVPSLPCSLGLQRWDWCADAFQGIWFLKYVSKSWLLIRIPWRDFRTYQWPDTITDQLSQNPQLWDP